MAMADFGKSDLDNEHNNIPAVNLEIKMPLKYTTNVDA